MAATTLMSFAEFERLEQGPDHIELLKGELIRVPPAQKAHNITCKRLFQRLDACIENLRQANPGLKLSEVYLEMGYLFPGTPASWLQPDVSLTQPDQPGDRYFTGAPWIAFQVVSESDTAPNLNAKVSQYLSHGAAEVWLIYPEQREAWVYDGSASARHEVRSINTGLLPPINIPFSEIF